MIFARHHSVCGCPILRHRNPVSLRIQTLSSSWTRLRFWISLALTPTPLQCHFGSILAVAPGWRSTYMGPSCMLPWVSEGSQPHVASPTCLFVSPLDICSTCCSCLVAHCVFPCSRVEIEPATFQPLHNTHFARANFSRAYGLRFTCLNCRIFCPCHLQKNVHTARMPCFAHCLTHVSRYISQSTSTFFSLLFPSNWTPCEYSQLDLNVKHDHEHEHDHHTTSRHQPSRKGLASWICGTPHGSRQGHPRYTGARTREGRGWPDNKSPRTTRLQKTPRQRQV